MISLALKWLARALFALALFSALTALFMYYSLNFGSCSEGGQRCEQRGQEDRCAESAERHLLLPGASVPRARCPDRGRVSLYRPARHLGSCRWAPRGAPASSPSAPW